MLSIKSISKKHWVVIELALLYAIYAIAGWIVIPRIFYSDSALSLLLFLIGSSMIYYYYVSPLLIHKDSLEIRGIGPRHTFFIRTDNLSKAWSLLLAPLLIVGSMIILAAWARHTKFFFDPDWQALFLKFFAYLFSATVQDLLFFSFILIRLKELVSFDSRSLNRFIVLTLFALTFSLSHLPNTPMMFLSFLFAFLMGFFFYMIPNLHAVIIVHAVLGTLLHRVYELNMKAGIFYSGEFAHHHLTRFIFPILDDIIGTRW